MHVYVDEAVADDCLTMSSDEDQIAAAEAELQECCTAISAELDKLQLQLSKTSPRSLSGRSHSEIEAAVLQQNEQMLRATIEQLNKDINDTSDIIPSGSPILRPLLTEELASDMDQLQQTASLLRKQRDELQQKIKRETEVKETLERLRTALQDELANTENVPRPQTSVSEVLAKAKEKRSKLRQLCKTRHDQMVAFVRKHFPPLTDEDVKKWCKMNSKSTRAVSASSFLSLEAILETLMTKCLETPNDAYIDQDETLWPPYIEMLLRSGMVQRHPTDIRRLRLTPYHY